MLRQMIVAIRWDEKSRSPERDAIRSQVIDALEAHEIKETSMKKISTTTIDHPSLSRWLVSAFF